jgi:mannose-1-phosphate guanylyltransferase/phosphomannomutase
MAYWNDVGGLEELRSSVFDAVSGRVRIDIPGEEILPGVWVEDGCAVDPTASVEGPVVLGRNVVVERGATIRGPAAIGADSRVGADAAIRSAALLPGSVVPAEGIAIAGIFGDASKLAESILRYPAAALS